MNVHVRDPRLLIAIVLCLSASSAIACKLPVFRYALERWSVDSYRMVVIIDGESNDQIDAAKLELKKIQDSQANIVTETIDLSKLSDQQLWQVEGLDSSETTPLLKVFFPQREGKRKLCWTGELTPESVRHWRDSKLRQQIVADITSGVSAVWILVEGADSQENDRMAAELESALAKAAAEISVPDGVILREDASDYLQQHPDASMDDVLRSDIPLKISFSLRRLAADNKREPALRAIVAAWNAAPKFASDRAYVFPVFGRGRMIEPLVAEHFSEDSVIAACRYLVGECNCTMKALNPGIDLVLDANWSEFMDESLVIVDAALPESPQTLEIPVGRQAQASGESNNPSTNKNRTLSIVVIGLLAMAVFALFGARRFIG